MAATLIPRRALFDNPTALGAKISPDGAWISWLAPFDSVMNVWIAERGRIADARPLTRTKGRPINWHTWTASGRYLVYFNDENGDENLHMFAVDPSSEIVRDLTPLDNIAARWSIGSRDRPESLIIGLNDRDPRWHDLHEVDLATGSRKLVWENTQELLHVGFDWSYTPRWARSSLPDGGARLWRVDGGKLIPWRDIAYEDELGTWPMMFTRANSHLHVRSSEGRNTLGRFRRIHVPELWRPAYGGGAPAPG
jgi:acylaminoacyl-peptidase